MKHHAHRLGQRYGFTLIELLVAATVMAVLTATGVVAFTNINRRSRDSKRVSDIEQLRSALEMYRSDMGYYPAVSAGTFGNASLLNATLVNTYMPKIPSDPKTTSGFNYYYQARNLVGANYYGYCLCAMQESLAAPSNDCSGVSLDPDTCNYAMPNP